MLDQQSRKRALAALSAAYPDPRPELQFTSPYELLVATMLSAHCTDKQVNKCTRVLFPMYNTAAQIAALTEDELFPFIRSCGLYQTKGRNIISASKILMEQYGGEVPHDRDALMELPGVGRKTANVVVSNAFKIPVIAVDTHVFRVANRIGFASAKDVLNTEKQLMEAIPEADWGDAHHWLILHGRRVCDARKPQCGNCCVNDVCEHYKKTQIDQPTM